MSRSPVNPVDKANRYGGDFPAVSTTNLLLPFLIKGLIIGQSNGSMRGLENLPEARE